MRSLLMAALLLLSGYLFAQIPRKSDFKNIDPSKVDTTYVPTDAELDKYGISREEFQELKKNKSQQKHEDFKSDRLDESKARVGLDKRTDTTRTKQIFQQFEKGEDTTKSGIYGHRLFKDGSISIYKNANNIKAPDNYILGHGDEISIAIWGYSDFSENYKVDQNGAIDPRLVGRIYLKGMTFGDAKSLLKKRFGQVYDLRNSQIDIQVNYSRVITVNIVGEVDKPGAYTVSAINSAFNVIALSGGPTDIGSVRNIRIKREGKTIKELDVYEYLLNPIAKQDFFLLNDDYLIITTAKKIVKVTGEVKRPFKYELKEGEGLLRSVEFAGGLSPSAYRSNIQIKRFQDNREVIIDVNIDSLLKSNKDFELHDGDEVIINKIPKGIVNFVELRGAFKIPGIYELKEGDRVKDIVERAEGVLIEAAMNRAFVIRLKDDYNAEYLHINLADALDAPDSDDNALLKRYDIIQLYSKKDFIDSFTVEVFGAIRKPGKIIYGQGLYLKDVLYMAGGLKPEAANTKIEVARVINYNQSRDQSMPTRTVVFTTNVNYDLSLTQQDEEFLLMPNDQIFVRKTPEFELQKNVVLLGEVNYPGVYSLVKNDEKLFDIIQRAGGLKDVAFTDGIRMYRPYDSTGYLIVDYDKVLKRPDSRWNYTLEEGDTIYVPRVKDLVKISGAIDYPDFEEVNVPFIRGKRAGYYIRNYGAGFAKEAHRKKTYVKESNGRVRRTVNLGFMKIYPKVTSEGATVVVREKSQKEDRKNKEPIDWNRTIENTTVKLTGVLTLWLLILNIQTRK